MGFVLTVCSGHPLAIVGKSGQRHVKVRDHLRSHRNEKNQQDVMKSEEKFWQSLRRVKSTVVRLLFVLVHSQPPISFHHLISRNHKTKRYVAKQESVNAPADHLHLHAALPGWSPPLCCVPSSAPSFWPARGSEQEKI